MQPIICNNGLSFFFTNENNRASRPALYSHTYNKAALIGEKYPRDSDENHILNSEYDYSGFAAKTEIINLTQHDASEQQVAQGIIDMPAEHKGSLRRLLTFPGYYTKELLEIRAQLIVILLREATRKASIDGVMIGGMPSFMPVLEKALKEADYRVGYACSERVSQEETLEDGSVKKTNVFVHVGMYWA